MILTMGNFFLTSANSLEEKKCVHIVNDNLSLGFQKMNLVAKTAVIPVRAAIFPMCADASSILLEIKISGQMVSIPVYFTGSGGEGVGAERNHDFVFWNIVGKLGISVSERRPALISPCVTP